MDNSEILTEIKILKTALIGIDGSNGLRGELRNFIEEQKVKNKEYETFQDNMEKKYYNYLNVERHNTCFWLHDKDEMKNMMKEAILDIKNDITENNEIKKTKITINGQIIIQVIVGLISISAIILTFILNK